MNSDAVRKMLDTACKKAGSRVAWAARAGVTPQYVYDVISGRREPAAKILAALRVRRDAPSYSMIPRARRRPAVGKPQLLVSQ
jgi:DNA-binding transcriptional regulator YdaS (Cro superfamily)